MKVAIIGDRNIDERNMKLVQDAVQASRFEISEVVSGCARGGDKLGEKWASTHAVPIAKFPADWKNIDSPNAIIKEGAYGPYNARAGFDRNQQMVEYSDAIIALQPDGDTNGTQDCIDRAINKGIPVFLYPANKKIFSGFAYEF